MKKDLFVDFDSTIVNTIASICELYNEDFKYYKAFHPVKWWEVETWDFQECNCTTPDVTLICLDLLIQENVLHS